MKKTRRTAKVGEMIRDALVDVLRRDVKDVDLGLVSINAVDVSPDLHYARVYITGFKEDDAKAAVKELQNRRGRIRAGLGQRIHLRYTPELDFKYDETAMRASRIEALLMEVMPPKSVQTDEGAEADEDAGETADDETSDDEPADGDAADDAGR